MKPFTFYEAIEANKRKTWIIIFVISILLFLVCYAIVSYFELGEFGILVAFLMVFFVNYYAYKNSDKIILKYSGVREPTKEEFPYLLNVVEGLSIAAGIPTPKIYVMDDPSPNAFATGKDPKSGVVVVTKGLLDLLDRLELEGVIAHEISHIKNYDVRLQTVAAVMVGLIVILGDSLKRSFYYSRRRRDKDENILGIVSLVIAILAPFLATLLKFALSRQREYMADANAAMLTRYPEGLASALEKISKNFQPVKRANTMTAPLYIVNPLKGGMSNLFSTHPPIEDRIRRLRMMGERWKLLDKEG
ncbi:MAG: zinc metalloprotease HtpX [Dictyoglomus thermophilum]|uniref:Protease HtpX homolog n=1 Tax=Dictyoglomus thermophilum TaxID=14 RepID=A0A7V3ZJL1_DICTH|nr:zinc metalloprotease HtpX [Dictyoglomus thermophilum]MCX7721249.1 zinc metalloprotease HtpX [Dictyoglomus thermophilum]